MDNQHDHGAFVANFQNHKGSEVKIQYSNGRSKIIPYVHCTYVDYFPEIGIIMVCSFGRITLSGRNLGDLSDDLGRRKIDTVREQHTHEREVPEDEPYIANILFEERGS